MSIVPDHKILVTVKATEEYEDPKTALAAVSFRLDGWDTDYSVEFLNEAEVLDRQIKDASRRLESLKSRRADLVERRTTKKQ